MRLIQFTTRMMPAGWMNPEKIEVAVWVNPNHVAQVYKLKSGGALLKTTDGPLEVTESAQTVISRLEETKPYIPGLWEE